MEYDKKFVKDFVERTKYNLIQLGPQTDKEVTLLLNSLLGLLIIPEQKGYDELGKFIMDTQVYEDFCNKAVRSTEKDAAGNLPQKILFRHLRNAVAHANIKFGLKDHKINRIILYDKEACSECNQSKHRKIAGKQYCFYVESEIPMFRNFVIEFATAMANHLSAKQKNSK